MIECLLVAVPDGRKFGMRTQDFPAHVARMHQNNDYLFSNEFTVRIIVVLLLV